MSALPGLIYQGLSAAGGTDQLKDNPAGRQSVGGSPPATDRPAHHPDGMNTINAVVDVSELGEVSL
jgi:hypothetical protein